MEAAVVSQEKGTAVVTLRSAVSDEVLKKAVEEKDYTVVEIRKDLLVSIKELKTKQSGKIRLFF